MPKEPGFYFYTGDWLKDPLLRICSKAAKGCWIDMLAILDGCPFRGVFVTATGSPWTDREIAGALGGDAAENVKAIEELLRLGVATRNQKGAIYSRRMVRDQQIRELNSARKRKERRVTRSKESKCVTQSVTHNVTHLSEEEIEIEIEKEVVGSSLQNEPPPNEIHLEVGIETFDSEAFVRKIRDIYVPRGVSAPMVELACFEAVEGEVKDRNWRRSEVANYIVERTSIAADLMRKWPADQRKWWPTLYTFLHERSYNNEISTWERTDGNGAKADKGAVVDGALDRIRARRASAAAVQGSDSQVPEFKG